MKTLQSILILFTLLISTQSFSQTWQHVGTAGSIGNADEMDFVIAETGDMYVFYKDVSFDWGGVKKWNGSSWQALGSPINFSSTTTYDYRIETMSDGTPVISYKESSGTDRIIVEHWNGTAWVTYGSTSFEADLFYLYDMTVGSDDQVSILYWNLNPSCGTTSAYIWLDVNIGSQTQVSGLVVGSIYNTISIAKSLNPLDHWELHGNYSTTDAANLAHSGTLSFEPAPGGAEMHSTYGITSSEAEVRDVNGSEKFVAIYKEEFAPNHTTFVRYYDVATDTYSSEFTLAAGIIESDMAVSSDGFVYTMDEHGTYGMTKIDLSSMTGVTYANAFTTTAAIDNPRVDTENGVIAVAWINESTNAVEVYEEVIVPSVTAYGDITVCSQSNYATSDTNFTISGNYDHTAEIYSVTSNNDAVINSGSITITGTYPNFSLEFPTGYVASNTVVELTVTAVSGAGTASDVISVNVTTPNITATVPDNICKNVGPLLLNPLVTPSGGTWSGSNVSNNKFYMSNITPGVYNLIYTVTNNQGCIGKDTSSITVFGVPNLAITTTLTTCSNNDGTASVDINSGDVISNYDVYWSTGQSDVALIENLAVGSYFVNVTDANNCTAVGQASINSNEFSVAETLTQIDCHGDHDGAIDLTITGTTGPYTKVWSNGQLTEDLTNLGAGVYNVTITDINGCQAVQSYTIIDPGEIFANIDITNADCGLDNGSLETSPVGGTDPLTFQWFEQGGAYIDNINLITNLGGGMYYIVITDDNGCTKLKNITLNEIGGPSITIDSVFDVSCVNTGSIYTTISSTAAIASIDWSNGATTDDIIGLATGFYALQVEDVNTCIGMASVEVVNAQPAEQLICMVTVDSATNTNRVVWEKPVTTDISHFNIYRETSVIGNYQFVDSVLYADESFFNDTIASPFIRSWRYKIAAVDVCGNEGELSEIHKTIHLTINTGLSGVINLAWDDYEGFPYSTFDIYRHTDMNGWELIESLPSNTFSLTDIAPSSVGLSYMIVIDPPSTCTSTKATDYNSSRSNRSTSGFDPTGVGIGKNVENEVNVYPNPTNDKVIVAGKLKEGSIVELIDFNGKIIQTKLPNANITEFNLAGFADGIYTIKYITEAGVFIEKVVKL